MDIRVILAILLVVLTYFTSAATNSTEVQIIIPICRSKLLPQSRNLQSTNQTWENF